jgi:RimJ/RimL family protein N-acetyltransferase
VSIALVTPTPMMLDAALGEGSELRQALECDVAEGWNGFPEALRRTRDALVADPESAHWGARLFVLEQPRTLVGWGGFKGPPRDGTVELGYEIAPGWRGRGLATAAARELLSTAFAAADVRAVIAHTLAEPSPSGRVLEKAGFAYEREVADDQVGTAWRYRLERGSARPG